MAAPTTQELLDKVLTAIAARIDGGGVDSYSIGGRNLRYSPLNELRALKKELEDQIKAETAAQNVTRNYAGFRRPV